MESPDALFSGLEGLVYVLAMLVIVLTVTPLLPFPSWVVRMGDFPRVQIATVGILAVATLLLISNPVTFPDLVVLTLASVAVVYQIHAILPYTILYPKEVESATSHRDDRTIRLLIANVLVDNEDPRRLLQVTRDADPDVVLLAETNERWIEGIRELKKTHKLAVEEPQENAYGMAMYSRLALDDPEVRFIVEDDVPSIHAGIRLRSGDTVRFFGVHPRPPVPSETGESTGRDAELVLVGRLVSETDSPAIVAGDMNDVAWSRTTGLFQKISGMLDPRKGRGMFNSFHASYPVLRFPLDHIFHSPHFRLVELRRLPNIGSDHFPILAVLCLEQGAESKQEAPVPDADDEKEADERVREAERKNNTKAEGESGARDD